MPLLSGSAGLGGLIVPQINPWNPSVLNPVIWIDNPRSDSMLDGSNAQVAANATFQNWRNWAYGDNSQNFSQATSGRRAIRRTGTQNGLDSAEFDGVNDAYTLADAAQYRLGTGDFTFAFVGVVNNASKGAAAQHTIISKSFQNVELNIYQGRIGMYAGGTANAIDVGGVTNGQWFIGIISRLGGRLFAEINGASFNQSITNTANASGSGTNFAIGERPGGDASQIFGPGQLGTLLVAPTGLIFADYERLSAYLAWQWGLVSSLPLSNPYRSSPP